MFREIAPLRFILANAANNSSDGPQVLATERAKKVMTMENRKGNMKVPRVLKVRTVVRIRKLVCLVRKNPKAESC